MNNNIIGIVIALVVVIGGGGYYMATQTASSDKKMMKDDKMMEKKEMEDKMMDKMDDKMMEKDGEMAGEDKMMKDNKMMKDGEEMMDDKMDDKMMDKIDDDKMMKDEAVSKSPGYYGSYSADKVAQATGNTVLNFYATWCPSCRALKSDIQASLADIPSDLTILEVDYDSETELKKKYGVTIQHTLVQVDNQGNMITSWRGGGTLEGIVANLR